MNNLNSCLHGNQRACRVQWECHYFLVIQHLYRSHYHGNGHLNDDSKSQRSIPIASCMILIPIHVRGRQSVRKVYMTSSQPFCICCSTPLSLRTTPSFLVEWPPYEVVLGTNGEEV